ncbi:MAG: o-succinylbenzoate synthase [Thermoanaerobaculia bacterium]
MRVESAVLRHVEMPLRFRFRTSFGETAVKKFLLLELRGGGLSGWGECVAEESPFYSPETLSTAMPILSAFLLPIVLGKTVASPAAFDEAARRVRGNRMAKAAVECALQDMFARSSGTPLGKALGGTRAEIEVGVSLGISPTAAETVENVRRHVAQGYRRIKLKIEPGRDFERLAAVREAFPDVPLTVDANAAYTLADADRLRSFDAFHLDYIEQPLHHEDLVAHAELAKTLKTPICLDESIRSAADASAAIALGACRVVNIKIGRVGGHGEAVRIHDAARAAGLPVWCGGMLEAGVGRAHNVAIASLPGFSKPGDTSSSSRYFEEDIVEPALEAANGLMPVPAGPGTGVTIRSDVLARFTTGVQEFRP